MNSCETYRFLNIRKMEAWGSKRHHDVMALNREIREHEETCSICNGSASEELVLEFFALVEAPITINQEQSNIHARKHADE